MADTRKIGKLIKRGAIRTALEILQSEMSQRSLDNIADKDDADDPSVEAILDIPYVNRNEVPLAMDIFKPVVPEGTELPVVVFIHGGGLVIGDRKMSRMFAKQLAKRGYLTFSVEYRTAPRATICEQLDDVCAGMDQVGRKLVDFDVDFSRIFLIAESAGALLASYVAAMKQSKKLQRAIGYKPSRMIFRGIGLISGMFYTNKPDPIGIFLSDQFYGDKAEDKYFMKFMDPEQPEILENLPPAFLVTSQGDFLRNYTLMYHDALKNAGRPVHLMDFDSEDLGHAFVAMNPELEESSEAIDEMLKWFEERAEEQRKEEKKELSPGQKEINRRIEDGSIIDQKIWSFIRELNSSSEDRLNALALVDGERTYTYRQFFRKWDRYAEAFTGLGFTAQNHARVALIGEPVTEVVTSFYALNMTGASVSLLNPFVLLKGDSWMKSLKVEHITDLLISSYFLTPATLREILDKKDEYGIRNVVVLPVRISGPCTNILERTYAEKNEQALRKVEGAVFFDDCLLKYEATPVTRSDQIDAAAAIVHTSGTTKGVSKPVPYSDRALNAGALHFLQSETYVPAKANSVSVLFMDLGGAYGLFDQLHMPLAFGCELVMACHAFGSPHAAEIIRTYDVNLWFTAPLVFDLLTMLPDNETLDFSSLDFVAIGGFYMSPDKRRMINELLRKEGCGVGVCNGYGSAEAGGACLISPENCLDDSIGYPLPGISVRIHDEEKNVFYTIDDGPRSGVLYIASDSISSGVLDGEVLFELTKIDGTDYVCTYDLVNVNQDGSLTYAGRANRYFINNEGIRFDAGLVETAVSAQNGIDACAVVPLYSKMIHDTFPLLAVKVGCEPDKAVAVVEKALNKVYIADKKIDQTALISQVLITDSIPYNTNGKVDIYKITNGQVEGQLYDVVPEKNKNRVKSLKLQECEAEVGADMTRSDALPDSLDREVLFIPKLEEEGKDAAAGPLPPSPFPEFMPPVGPLNNLEEMLGSLHPFHTAGLFNQIPEYELQSEDLPEGSQMDKEDTMMKNTMPYDMPMFPFMPMPYFMGSAWNRGPACGAGPDRRSAGPGPDMPGGPDKKPGQKAAAFESGKGSDPRMAGPWAMGGAMPYPSMPFPSMPFPPMPFMFMPSPHMMGFPFQAGMPGMGPGPRMNPDMGNCQEKGPAKADPGQEKCADQACPQERPTMPYMPWLQGMFGGQGMPGLWGMNAMPQRQMPGRQMPGNQEMPWWMW